MSARVRPIARPDGFTSLETTLVVLIVTILAVAVLPSYVGSQDRADDEAKALVRDGFAAAKRNGFRVSRAELLRLEPRLRDATALRVHTRKRTFALQLTSADGRTFAIRRTASGRIHRRCTPVGGGCHDGRW